MPDGAPPDEGLGDGTHLDGGQHPRGCAVAFEGVRERERVHDRRQHAHVVGSGSIHALRARGEASKDVAAADYDGDFHPELSHVDHVPGNLIGDDRIDAVRTIS